MQLSPELRQRLDNMNYAQLLRTRRFAPAGDDLFEGESGDYLVQRMKEMRADPAIDHVGASKQVGW